MNWYKQALKKYVVFAGRARRTEYWVFTFVNVFIGLLLGFVDNMAGLIIRDGVGVLGAIYALAVLLPGLSVSVRRLHDTGRSAWWLLLAFIPIIGFIVLIVFMVLPGEAGPNKFGPDPKTAV